VTRLLTRDLSAVANRLVYTLYTAALRGRPFVLSVVGVTSVAVDGFTGNSAGGLLSGQERYE